MSFSTFFCPPASLVRVPVFPVVRFVSAWGLVPDSPDVAARLRNGIVHFFQVYKDLEAKRRVVTSGFGNRSDAQAIIAACRERDSAI